MMEKEKSGEEFGANESIFWLFLTKILLIFDLNSNTNLNLD